MAIDSHHLLVHIEAIANLSHMLLDLAIEREFPASFRRDLEQMRESAKAAYLFVKSELPASDASLSEERVRRFRHDLKNRLNHIDGLCQFLLQAQEEASLSEDDAMWGAFIRDFEQIRAYVRLCKTEVEQWRGDDGDRHEAAGLASPTQRVEWGRHVAPGKVLVADDSPLNRDLLQRFLSLQRHEVVLAGDGREALDLLRGEDFDLVLLDILMPEFSGLQVLDAMKAMGKLNHTPVIVISGLDSTAVVVECLQKGADDFLTRPIDMDILQARVNACLEKKRLRERELQQFFPESIARQFLSDPQRLSEGRRAEVTILFCDIQNFSALSEGLGPIETIQWLSDVMNFLSCCVLEHEGVLVDYIGDELLAMWGAPHEQPRHAELACRAAHAMLRGAPEVSGRWRSAVQGETAIGIGLNSGEAFVGNIGTRRKFKYGPLGNTVNLASRVQGATRYFQSSLLITEATRRQLGPQWLQRRLSQVRVRNIRAPFNLYELASPTQEESAWRRLRDDYEQALAEYQNRRFHRAASILGNLLLAFPNDGPSLLLMSRTVNALLESGDGENDFDPVWTLPGK